MGRFLRANGVEATILDNDSDRVDLLRRMGFKVYYGDVTRHDLLESAGAASAKILISAVDGLEVTRARWSRQPGNTFRTWRSSSVPGIASMPMSSWTSASGRCIANALTPVCVSARMSSATRVSGPRRPSGRAGVSPVDEEAMQTLAPTRHDLQRHVGDVRERIALQEALLTADRDHNPS